MPARVPVSPTVLEWAADVAGMDPERIQNKFPKWDEWLSGDRQPTMNQLTSLATTAGVPFGYLLLRDPPARELPIPDFREGFGGQVGEPSSNLLAVLNQSIRRQDWYRDYAHDNTLPAVDVVGAGHNLNIIDVAANMRERLQFDVGERRGSWTDARKRIIGAFEDLGGLTVVTSMVDNNTHRILDPDEFRGFTLIDEYAPLIFVNARQTLNGQIFTLAHELAHIWDGTSGVSLEDPAWEPRVDVERWCNAVASEFLVPSADLARRYPSVSHLALTSQLESLASVYKCGTLVVLQAIRHSELVTFDDFSAVYDAEVRRLDSLASTRASEGGGNFLYNQPFRVGERFSRALIRDTLEGRTPISEALHLTSLRSLSNFDKYARHLGAA